MEFSLNLQKGLIHIEDDCSLDYRKCKYYYNMTRCRVRFSYYIGIYLLTRNSLWEVHLLRTVDKETMHEIICYLLHSGLTVLYDFQLWCSAIVLLLIRHQILWEFDALRVEIFVVEFIIEIIFNYFKGIAIAIISDAFLRRSMLSINIYSSLPTAVYQWASAWL